MLTEADCGVWDYGVFVFLLIHCLSSNFAKMVMCSLRVRKQVFNAIRPEEFSITSLVKSGVGTRKE